MRAGRLVAGAKLPESPLGTLARGYLLKEEAKLDHEPCSLKEHGAGNQGKIHSARFGVQVSSSRKISSRQPVHRSAQIWRGGFRERVFPAQASTMQKGNLSLHKRGLLAPEVPENRREGSENKGSALENGMESPGDLGVRVGKNGKTD
jgi:hypothetical protein